VVSMSHFKILGHSAVLGAQWGDEGKGKIVDLMAPKFDLVVRFQGGNNAGHTVVVKGKKTVLHLLPSGLLSPKTINLIGHGAVVDPQHLWDEIENLRAKGVEVTPKNLKISSQATVIHHYAKLLDQMRESNNKSVKIGTTGKGIGPAYEDKIARRAIKMCDLLDEKKLHQLLEGLWQERGILLFQLYQQRDVVRIEEELLRLQKLGENLAPFYADDMEIIDLVNEKSGNILYEGAQGMMLDINFGTYPFVTSSSTTIGGIFTGSYIPRGGLKKVIGVAKAYTTRVGSGAFPTEIIGAQGDLLQKLGSEVGATTGRIRRCGWLDLAQLKYAVKVSGYTEIALTKVDILQQITDAQVCVGYDYRGKFFDQFQMGMKIEELKPRYESIGNLSGELKSTMTREDLPQGIKAYIEKIEKHIQTPVSMISYGPERDQIIFL